ncbi:hypothetical protein [Bacillus sp. OTU530]|uniref:hypothetical protein n=1 Tax=Bacillus sp. OTU530 TaxID=3043862 RepID=UPI00313ACC01
MTQWEDLEKDVIAAMGTSEDKLGDFEGATKKVGDALQDNLTAKWEVFKRESSDALGQFAQNMLFMKKDSADFWNAMSKADPGNGFSKFMAVIGNIKGLFTESSLEVKAWSATLSESQQKALNSYTELSNGATLAIQTMFINQTALTSENTEKIKGMYSQMNSAILTNLQDKNNKELSMMQTMFATTFTLTDHQEATILQKIVEGNAKQTQSIQEREAKIQEILTTASNEKRALTEAEKTQILQLTNEMNQQMVDAIAVSVSQQKVLLEDLKNNAGVITAQQAATVAQNAAKQRDDTIAAAQAQYEQVVANAIYQRDERGTLSADEAAQVIQSAEEARTKATQEANGTYTEVVDLAKKQAGEHASKVDWETGQVKSKFEDMKTDAVQKAGDMHDEVTSKASEAGKAVEAMEWVFGKFILPKIPQFKWISRTIDAVSGALPQIGFDWFATGGVFTGPSVVGLGEKGPEAIVPLQGHRMTPFAEAIASEMPNNGKTEQSAQQNVVIENVILMDGYEIARATTPHIDTMQGKNFTLQNYMRGGKE